MKVPTGEFARHWQDKLPTETIELLVGLLMKTGKQENEAVTVIAEFWNDAFHQGQSDEAFNNAGECT